MIVIKLKTDTKPGFVSVFCVVASDVGDFLAITKGGLRPPHKRRRERKTTNKKGTLRVPFHVTLFYDLSVALTESASSICFIGIDVHSKRKLGRNAANDVAEHEASSVGLDLNAYNILIVNALLFCICGCHVDVTLCNDHAAIDHNFTCRTNELAGGGAFNVAAFANGSSNSERSCIGERNLDLTCRTGGSENGNVGDGFLRADNVYSFFTSKLTGLREHLLNGELVPLTEKNINVLLCEMNMTCGGFNEDLLCHDYILTFLYMKKLKAYSPKSISQHGKKCKSSRGGVMQKTRPRH